MGDAALTVLLALTCIGAPGLVVALPLMGAGVWMVRRRFERRWPIALLLSLGNALAVGLLLGFGGAMWAGEIGDESAGDALALLVAMGLTGGATVGFFGTLGVVLLATRPRPPAPPDAPPQDALGGRALGAAIALLVLGVVVSLAGLVFSVSLGLFTLAFAELAVRPIALAFVALHVAAAIACSYTTPRTTQRGAAIASVLVSVLGVLLAGLIAAFGPGFFHDAMEQSIAFMLV